jgi:hypothetical protein
MNFVPGKAHGKPDRTAVEPNPDNRHIAPMTAKPDQTDAPKPADRDKPAVSRDDISGDGRKRPREIGGPKGPEPTRYGDWEVGGRCTDF